MHRVLKLLIKFLLLYIFWVTDTIALMPITEGKLKKPLKKGPQKLQSQNVLCLMMKSNAGMFSFLWWGHLRLFAHPLTRYSIIVCFLRLELQREREKQKEAEVEALKRSMQSGMVFIISHVSVICYLLTVICYLSSVIWLCICLDW